MAGQDDWYLRALVVHLWRLFYRRVPANAALWAVVQVAAGYAAHRMSPSVFRRAAWLLRPRPIERDGRFYEEALHIRRWKGRLPEAGAVFAGGFDKSRIASRDPAYLCKFISETERAELAHWLALVPTPLFVRYNPRLVAVCMPVYALAVNAPCIAAQRYNRIRLTRVLVRRTGPAGSPPPAPAAPWAR